MSAHLIVLAVLVALAYVVDSWPSSGSRPVALAHASTSDHHQNVHRSRFNAGAGKPSRSRFDQVVTVFRSTPNRSAICWESTRPARGSSVILG